MSFFRFVPLACLVVLGSIWVLPVWAGTYYSDMGYSVDLPQGWTMLNRDNVRERPELVDAAASAARKEQDFRGIPSRIVTRVKELLAGGQIEYFHSPDPRFSVSVLREAGKVPIQGFNEEAACRNLEQELSEQNQREMRVYGCSAVTVDGRPALRVEADDYWEDRRYIQYLVRAGSGDVLILTANTREENDDEMEQEFEALIKSLNID